MAEITIEHLRIDYPLYGSSRSLRKEFFERAAGGFISHERNGRRGRVVIKALEDISLHLADGDRLALIGHNGAGKTTLLKAIAGIYEPVAGRVDVRGRLTPLFDTMPGLDVDDTGYENVVTAGLLLGLSRAEIEAAIPDIERFSELGEYLSLPVRTYSAGMLTRLSFSVVTGLEPGILLMDEGIATGDAEFSERAARRMNEFIGRSHILVLASHAEGLLQSLCNRAALMKSGRILKVGGVDEVLAAYHADIERAA